MKLNEGTFEGNSIAVYDGENGLTQIYKRGNGYYGINDDFDFHFESKAELEMMLKKWRYRLIAGGLKENKMKKLKESAMAELDIAAQEAPTFEAFVKTVKQEFPQLASDLNKPEVISFLQNMYDDAKMRENKTTMKKSELRALIKECVCDALKEATIPENTLMSALKKAGIEVEDDMNVELKGPTGKTKIVTVNPDGKVTMDEGIKDSLIKAVCFVSLLGAVACNRPDDSDLRPNNTQTELPSDDEENVAPVDFLNTTGKTVTINNILAGLGKYIPKPKFKKGDTVQYKQQTMKPDIKMGLPDSVNIPDSTTNRSDAPWVGYWKFTDPCRTNNQQVMIWTQVGNDMKKGIIYSGYQLPDTNTIYSARTYKILADGKKYIISAYTISSIFYDEAKAHMTVTMSSPESDSGKPRILEIDYSGDNMRITSWTAGNAIRVNGLDGFKW